MRVAVLASGRGSNLQALIDGVHGREAEIVGVASDRAGAPALDRAAAAGIPAAVFLRDDYEDRTGRDLAMGDWVLAQGAELVVLAGYMALLDPAFIARFPDRIVNVHPSLLPAFSGLHAVEQAVAYGVKVVGVTVHLVDDGVDTGSIVLQRAIAPPDVTDPEAVAAALHEIEHELLPEAVRLFARGAVRRDPAEPRWLVRSAASISWSRSRSRASIASPSSSSASSVSRSSRLSRFSCGASRGRCAWAWCPTSSRWCSSMVT